MRSSTSAVAGGKPWRSPRASKMSSLRNFCNSAEPHNSAILLPIRGNFSWITATSGAISAGNVGAGGGLGMDIFSVTARPYENSIIFCTELSNFAGPRFHRATQLYGSLRWIFHARKLLEARSAKALTWILRADSFIMAALSFLELRGSWARLQMNWRASPHCRVVNLVRSGRKQPQLLTASAGGKARLLSSRAVFYKLKKTAHSVFERFTCQPLLS